MELGADGQAVYEALTRATGATESTIEHVAVELGMDPHHVVAAVDSLVDLGLVRHPAEPEGALEVADPRLGLARLITDHELRVRRDQDRVLELRSLMEQLAVERESRLDRESLVHHLGVNAVRGRLAELAETAKKECVSLNPGRLRLADTLEASRPLNQWALDNGVAIRCVYQDCFRYDADTSANARWLSRQGGQVRVLPSVPLLMVIVDGEVALVPRNLDDVSEGALEIRQPSVVAALQFLFELAWRVAAPVQSPHHRGPDPSNPTTRDLLALLAGGITDDTAARRLGVSTRTVRRIMADVMAQLGVTSRFQAGIEVARRGWV